MVLLKKNDTDKLRDKVKRVLTQTMKPSAKKSDLSLSDLAYQEDMQGIIELVDLLLLHRDRIAPALMVAKNSKPAREKSNPDDELEWPSQYTYWSKIPKYWITSWLGKRHSWVTEDLISSPSKTGGRNKVVREMFEYETGLKEAMEVDPKLHNKQVMTDFLNKLAEARGNHLKDFRTTCMEPGGEVSWTGGAFRYGSTECPHQRRHPASREQLQGQQRLHQWRHGQGVLDQLGHEERPSFLRRQFVEGCHEHCRRPGGRRRQEQARRGGEGESEGHRGHGAGHQDQSQARPSEGGA